MKEAKAHKFHKSRLLVWIFPLSVAALIFVMSAAPGDISENMSRESLSAILGILGLERLLDIPWLAFILEALLRKAAHIAEFTLLWVSCCTAFCVSGVRGFRSAKLSLLLTFLYAVSDEFHQIFVYGRNASAGDVLIDIGVPLLVSLLLYCRTKRRENPSFAKRPEDRTQA